MLAEYKVVRKDKRNLVQVNEKTKRDGRPVCRELEKKMC